MLTTTKATITLNGANLTASREGFLSDSSLGEALLNESLNSSSVYKRDLLMFAGGDLFVNSREFFSSGDLADVGGLLNYAQAITHRLMTTRGTHPEDRFFGVPWNRYIGISYVSRTLVSNNLVADITEELYKDRRTSEVISVVTNFISNSVLEVSCSVKPVIFPAGTLGISVSVEDR